MSKYRIIGCMTGNSMDAIDLVLSEFDEDSIKDVCSYSVDYLDDMREKMANLRAKVYDKFAEEILDIKEFEEIHNEYVKGVGNAIDEMCEKFGIDKKSIDAIGFHGKTLDHYPVSKAKMEGRCAYTLQIGSGKMLADLVGIKVIYDFRSLFVMNGKEGAPLVGRHNVNIAKTEGEGVFFNGGNTSNFAVVSDEKILYQTDVGPFNEYVDMFVREHIKKPFDKDGMLGKKGRLCADVLQKVFEIGRNFYEKRGAKSGDPQYYKTFEVMKYLKECGKNKYDIVNTLEYFSAYLAVRELIQSGIDFENVKLFGGGWKNPVIRESFENLLKGKGVVLDEDRECFRAFWDKNKKINVVLSAFGESMEARLMADMARYRLEEKPWDEGIVSGMIASPRKNRKKYDDMLSLAAKGWNKLEAYR